MKCHEFKFEPFKGTDLIKLGLTSEEYQNILGVKPTKFYKSEFNTVPSDDFDFCHIHYNENKKSNYIDFFLPTKITFNDFVLMDKKSDGSLVKEYIKSLDPLCEVSEDTVESFEKGIYIYMPEGFVECISIYIPSE